MSLLLCRQEPVKQPYYFDNLGVHIYSSQELAYVIYNHPLLMLDGFIDDHLIRFIREELDMEFLSTKVDRWLKSGESPDEALIMILQETYYYYSAEVNKFRQMITAFQKLHPAELEKRKADYLFELKQYGKAIAGYERALAVPKDQVADDAFRAKVWNNLGASYARLFLFEKAFTAYQKSYDLLNNTDILQKMYYIRIFKPSVIIKERYQSGMTHELQALWDTEYSTAQVKAKETHGLGELEEIFRAKPDKRMQEAGDKVQKWKQEYRSMI